VVRCSNYCLCSLRRAWQWSGRPVAELPGAKRSIYRPAAHGKNNYYRQYFQYASCCPWSFNLYRYYHCRVFPGYGLFGRSDGRFLFSLGWSSTWNRWPNGGNAWWWRLSSLFGQSSGRVLWTGRQSSLPGFRAPGRSLECDWRSQPAWWWFVRSGCSGHT